MEGGINTVLVRGNITSFLAVSPDHRCNLRIGMYHIIRVYETDAFLSAPRERTTEHNSQGGTEGGRLEGIGLAVAKRILPGGVFFRLFPPGTGRDRMHKQLQGHVVTVQG